MEVVKGALGDTILNLDGALDVLLLRELHLVFIDALRLVPLSWRQALNHAFFLTLHLVILTASFVLVSRHLLIEGQWLVVRVSHAQLSV